MTGLSLASVAWKQIWPVASFAPLKSCTFEPVTVVKVLRLRRDGEAHECDCVKYLFHDYSPSRLR
jgi:hypothetical protein